MKKKYHFLTDEDIALLKECGESEEKDIKQIDDATLKKYTKYKLICDEGKNIVLTREAVISMLGREKYLSGIQRSAFHCSAVRETEDGKKIFFDSYKLFGW